MPAEPIFYHDRYTGELCEEQIYGEKFLRWAYETAFGRATTNALVKRAFFSQLYGWWVSRPASQIEAVKFVERFGLDPADFVKTDMAEFESFNDFFVRQLKPEARPIDPAEDSVVFPADGRHLGYGDFSEIGNVYAKGQRFDLGELLGSAADGEKFAGGAVVISRLCPIDYHRYHFPAAGVPGEAMLINGPLFSVSPIALRRRVRYVVENKRVVTRLQTENAGEILSIEVGATNVGSIHQTYHPGKPVAKGEEKGFFAFGGSMTITLFEPGRVSLAEDLLKHSAEGHELYARMGDYLGTIG